MGIERSFPHPQYDLEDENGPKNDIALLRLARPVEISPTVNTLCLPPPSHAEDEFEETVVIGWGKTENGTNSEVLQELDLQGGYSMGLQKGREMGLKYL